VRPIEVVAEGGRVVLRGQVPEYEIEAAIATARTVRGVADVENQLQPMTAARLSSDVDRLETL
jgi:osmotically-inducible protein OsmY